MSKSFSSSSSSSENFVTDADDHKRLEKLQTPHPHVLDGRVRRDSAAVKMPALPVLSGGRAQASDVRAANSYVPTWLVGLPETCATRRALRALELRHRDVAQHPVLKEHGYWLEENLGVGSYGAVFRATYVRPRRDLLGDRLVSRPAAVKVISKSLVPSKDVRTVRMHEVYIQLSVGVHENLVTLYTALETEHFLFMPMELCAGGELLDIVQNLKGGFDEQRIVRYAIHLCLAIAYLHSRGIVHLDVKLENLLLGAATRESRASGHQVVHDLLKLADFGFALRVRFYQLGERVNYSLAPFAPCREVITCGSLGYMALEVMKKLPVQPFTVDVFAMAACVYAMTYGQLPFLGDRDEEVLAAMKANQLNVPEHSVRSDGERKTFSRPLRQFLQRALELNPKKRLSSMEALWEPVFDHWANRDARIADDLNAARAETHRWRMHVETQISKLERDDFRFQNLELQFPLHKYRKRVLPLPCELNPQSVRPPVDSSYTQNANVAIRQAMGLSTGDRKPPQPAPAPKQIIPVYPQVAGHLAFAEKALKSPPDAVTT